MLDTNHLDIHKIHKIKDVCQALDIRQKEIIILGDTNCHDLSDEDKNTVIKYLRAFYREFEMKQQIRNSTHVTNRSDTLLDHFATNTPKFIAISGVKTISFNDHDLIYGIRKISSKVKNEPKRIRYRNLKHYDPIRFREELNMTIK